MEFNGRKKVDQNGTGPILPWDKIKVITKKNNYNVFICNTDF